jgi:hypothetical protein
MDVEPPIAFATEACPPAALEIRVNFGILAGRDATPAEIDDLARELLDVVEDVSITSEQHYEMSPGHEATVHLVKIEVGEDAIPDWNVDELSDRLIEAATRWAEACAEARHAEL